MCIRDRYQRRVHGEQQLEFEEMNKALACILVCTLIASGLTSEENLGVEFLTGFASDLGVQIAPKTLASINGENFNMKKILLCTYLFSNAAKYQNNEGAYCFNYFFEEAIELNKNLIANDSNLEILLNTAKNVFSDFKKFNQVSEYLDKGLEQDIRVLMTEVRENESAEQAGINFGEIVLKYWSTLDNLNDPNVRKYITQ
eukprot:TRINITY_DN465_c0_g1_i17.p1 TRINITY_DN465_c0_g1~~TRINITY_DN465_c0_g1_i17.p1  ORF type:complete len:200 (-),score=51.72 TRINITY_DN465_c0_g1_i17:98-697(-)